MSGKRCRPSTEWQSSLTMGGAKDLIRNGLFRLTPSHNVGLPAWRSLVNVLVCWPWLVLFLSTMIVIRGDGWRVKLWNLLQKMWSGYESCLFSCSIAAIFKVWYIHMYKATSDSMGFYFTTSSFAILCIIAAPCYNWYVYSTERLHLVGFVLIFPIGVYLVLLVCQLPIIVFSLIRIWLVGI